MQEVKQNFPVNEELVEKNDPNFHSKEHTIIDYRMMEPFFQFRFHVYFIFLKIFSQYLPNSLVDLFD